MRLGIDFGTSNSGAAVFDGRQVHLLPLDSHSPQPEVMKTLLYITREQQSYTGQAGIELYYRHNVKRLRRYVKKWVGELEYRGADMHYVRDVYTYVDELQPGRLLQYLKTALRKQSGRAGYHGTQIFERYYQVQDLVEVYLRHVRQRAEATLGQPLRTATLGRPVKFSDDPALDQQAEETLQKAALQAGFEQVDFEFEPVAAALYYERSLARPQTTLVFDFGGGTLDIAIMRLGDPKRREVYANGGIDIAGSDFDRAIIQKRLLNHFGAAVARRQPELWELVQAVPDWIALPEMSTPLNWQHLQQAIQAGGLASVQFKALQALIFNDMAFSFYNVVEQAKIALSSQGAVVIELQGQGLDIWELYTRSQFEEDIAAFAAQIEQVLLQTLAESGLAAKEIEAVVTTGGSSNIPLFHQMLERIFGAGRIQSSNAFSSVTAGLAIRAYEKEV